MNTRVPKAPQTINVTSRETDRTENIMKFQCNCNWSNLQSVKRDITQSYLPTDSRSINIVSRIFGTV